MASGGRTVVARVAEAGGRLLVWRSLPGTFTIPAVAYDGSAGGLSADGRTLALIEPRQSFPRAQTRFLILGRGLAVRWPVTLRGDFSFDAISPHGRMMFLIQYLSPTDPTSYAVRAYDVQAGRLAQRPVVDPTEPDEKMGGTPVSRANGLGGRWAYTLYSRPGEAPFLHALDTAGRTARCIDLDALTGKDASYMRLRLDPGGGTVRVIDRGRPLLTMDTRTFAVAAAAAPAKPGGGGSSFPWLPAAAGMLAVATAALIGVVVLRRRA
jgi:hypothetical protein